MELSAPQFNFNPELSYGSHFFLDMESDNILYLPVFAEQSNNTYASEWLDKTEYELGAHPAVRVYKGDFSSTSTDKAKRVWSTGTTNDRRDAFESLGTLTPTLDARAKNK